MWVSSGYWKHLPGFKNTVRNKGLSVQAQNRYPLRAAINQKGEQTLNKDAKSYSGIKNFANNESSVLKWTLSQAKQAENTKELLDIAGLWEEQTMYKPLQPSQILKSESSVQSLVQRVMETEYVNPFGSSLDKSKLCHLTSGTPLAADVICNWHFKFVWKRNRISNKIYEWRDKTNEANFQDAIRRNRLIPFKDSSKKMMLKKDNTVKTIEANRNILGTC